MSDADYYYILDEIDHRDIIEFERNLSSNFDGEKY